MQFALNQATSPNLNFAEFLDLAANLGCVGVEPRNDMKRPLFDGLPASVAGQMVRDRGLEIVGLSQVYPFNDWSPERRREIVDLAETARQCGAPGINLIPRVDGIGTDPDECRGSLRMIIIDLRPILADLNVGGWIEPIGFEKSSIRIKRVLAEIIEELGAGDHFGLIHDTFQHTIAADPDIFAAQTALVHISGISHPDVPLDESQDAHRVLIDETDRVGNVTQIIELQRRGYRGPFSFECTEPAIHALPDLESRLERSMNFLRARIAV
ncbi:MAG: TIM barrel protein [Hyphomicrobiaceae bacterium]|nr:TIM barrel protein [Hyphomicrobiaceae bacterium]MCC0023938.1 TIM barrel protein [Hyphomicrobiaceae bacterium]